MPCGERVGQSVGGIAGAPEGQAQDQRLGQRGACGTEGHGAGRLSRSCSQGANLDIRVVAVQSWGSELVFVFDPETSFPRIYVK